MSSSSSLLKRIVNVVLNIFITIFIIILLITIYTNIQVTILKNSYANFFGFSIFEVQTGSMEPAIKAGDCVITKFSNDFDTDDIVTFSQNGEFITHRVVEAYKGTYVTKGDANNSKDNPISREQIVGKVVHILPNMGLLRNTILNPVVLIATIITLYLISLVFKKNKKIKYEKKEVNSTMKFIENIKSLFKKRPEVKTINSTTTELLENRIEELDVNIEEPHPVKETIEIAKIDTDINLVEDNNQEEVEVPVDENIYRDDDLDKTMYFRMITVDEDELENSYKVIEQNELNDEKESKKVPKKTAKKENVAKKQENIVEVKEDLTAELDKLQKKKKKFKNIIERVIFIKEEELSKIVDILTKDIKGKPSVSSIKTTFIKTYIDAKYYNYCGNINVEYNKKNMTTKVNMALQEKANELIKIYKGSDKKYSEKVEKFAIVFNLIIYLEQYFLAPTGIKEKRENYKNKILKLMNEDFYEGPIIKSTVNEIIEVQKTFSALVKTSLEKLDTTTFKLIKNHISKNISGVYLEHNIAFSKVYSDYIVDKTYQEGVIAEDKIAVLITLLSEEILKDMLNCEFNQKYLMYIPESLYAKSNKLSSIFDKFEDEYAKTCTIVLIQYSELSRNTKTVRSLIKEGYKFAVDLSNTDKIKTKDMGVMELMSYIFIDRKTKEKKQIIATLSENAQSKVIYEEIETKLGSYWGN